MGLFDFFSANKIEVSPTGLYVVNDSALTPLHHLPKEGSYNDIAESLGHISFHGIILFQSDVIEYIAFRRKTKEPIFVEAKSKSSALTYKDIQKAIKDIDWDFEWRQLDFEDRGK